MRSINRFHCMSICNQTMLIFRIYSFFGFMVFRIGRHDVSTHGNFFVRKVNRFAEIRRVWRQSLCRSQERWFEVHLFSGQHDHCRSSMGDSRYSRGDRLWCRCDRWAASILYGLLTQYVSLRLLLSGCSSDLAIGWRSRKWACWEETDADSSFFRLDLKRMHRSLSVCPHI